MVQPTPQITPTAFQNFRFRIISCLDSCPDNSFPNPPQLEATEQFRTKNPVSTGLPLPTQKPIVIRTATRTKIQRTSRTRISPKSNSPTRHSLERPSLTYHLPEVIKKPVSSMGPVGTIMGVRNPDKKELTRNPQLAEHHQNRMEELLRFSANKGKPCQP